ncbi:stearoyl-CoA desaturase (delta-9desaturase) [Monoraphidium neglectum]|uniref:Stearoyl-CoA desaturase (Delta-9desaturase) n=1 Tax=Monoraphidium neglectum TaxID=145388 RepID=A0A0D2M5G5_9CHLO|nr:stearoyl-CoA desaturase (delta-9desaturase) [Monoraphidium neglectum]KIY98704.1 stearoyl-CoA desaturase (delta-9desaturase) [Monoraphidium neglectum]|eukprot:XP_013897724.1 stearoyl-CoA desaturase (delta-9desaturase) [Monoraphidium neglectum]
MAPVEIERSYSEAYDLLKGCKDPDVLNTAHPKLSQEAQATAPGARRIPFSDIYATGKGRSFRAGGLLNMPTKEIPTHGAKMKNMVTCGMRCTAIGSMHVILALYGYSTFTWGWAAVGWSIFAFCGIVGITLGYHRMLTHKSFKTYKCLEYLIAFVGTQAGQGDPIEWVSTHRYHHLHTDTPLDPHSPYEGFWWSHLLWLTGTEHSLLDYANVPDLKNQLFYKVMEFTFFPLLFIVKPVLMYQMGGMQAVCWTCAFPLVWGYHTTFLVNSASHIWGTRPFETGDLSTNCWWVALLAFGEGWHNAHHAFPYSARHGLEWYEFDATWILICAMKALGLVWDVQLPSEKAKALKRRKEQPPAAVVTAVVTMEKQAARKRKA